MADNPNKDSARSSRNGGTAPRRGVPSCPRLLDIEPNYRRFRNQNYHFPRSNGRNGVEPPPQQHTNRNGNPDSKNRVMTNGNYPSRVLYSSTAKHGQGRMAARSSQPSQESNENEVNADNIHTINGECSSNLFDGNIASSYKHDPSALNGECASGGVNSALLGVSEDCSNLNYSKNVKKGEASENASALPENGLVKGRNTKNSLKHFAKTPDATHSSEFEFNGNSNGFNIAERGAGLQLPELPSYRVGQAEMARFIANATGYNNRKFQEGHKDFNPMAAASPSLQLPPHPAYPNCSESMYSLPVGPQPNNNNARPDQNLPSSRGSFTSNPFELPRPVATQNNANSSEAVANLPHTVTSGALHEEWANAPEFIPKSNRPRSYAEVVNPSHLSMGMKVCPYTERTGECRIPHGACPNVHGEICEFCGRVALHPTDILKRNAHLKKCRERQERDTDMANAVARSKEKTCGICFEVVLEKQLHERRFGILTQCNHCFCLSCIRKWRQARQFENKVVRACPECRVTSDFVCPSSYWVDTKEDKDKLINNYKTALAEKQCKYFKQGRGRCPFGNKCFYLHALPDGTKTDVGPPPRRRRPRNRYPDDGELGDMLQQIILWDFLDEHDHHWLYSFADDIDEWVAFFSDSDESESWSEYECLFE